MAEFDPCEPSVRRYTHPTDRPAYLRVDDRGFVSVTVESLEGLLLLAGYTHAKESPHHDAADLISVEPS